MDDYTSSRLAPTATATKARHDNAPSITSPHRPPSPNTSHKIRGTCLIGTGENGTKIPTESCSVRNGDSRCFHTNLILTTAGTEPVESSSARHQRQRRVSAVSARLPTLTVILSSIDSENYKRFRSTTKNSTTTEFRRSKNNADPTRLNTPRKIERARPVAAKKHQ
ncbi:hypothetical protein [Actinopolyspora xinjiangensis]|uniref:hypothetical protein n=1 Tax=Actinopolyspora xinjiangensis TaxID=405564 RepID=UPI00111388F5|nr:hypothetical protein [Actinopolyspora xinjiangensis]